MASSIPATSAKVTIVSFSAKSLALLLLKDMTPIPGPILFMANRQIRNIMPKGENPGENIAQPFTLIAPGVIDLMLVQFLDQVGVVHPQCRESLLRFFIYSFDCSVDIFRTDDQFCHIAGNEILFELAVGIVSTFVEKKYCCK